jgi:Uncharacterized vancomycin resistance protein
MSGGYGMDESIDQRVGHGREQAAAPKIYGKEHRSKRRGRRKHYVFKRKNVIIISGLILIVVLSIAMPLWYYTRDRHVMLSGITISGINVGNLSRDEAKTIVGHEINRLENQTIKLNTGKTPIEVTLKDLGLTVSPDSALQKAYDLGRTGSLGNKLSAKLSASKGVNFDLSHTWDDKKMKEFLDKTLAKYNNPAIDASFDITPQNTMAIKSEHAGLVYSQDELTSQIKNINISKPIPELNVTFKDQLPQITAQQLEDQKISGLLASYTTHFDPSQTARSDNVRIAAKALDRAVIKPGDILSFNKIVGERTVQGGYKDAYIIVNGQFVPGLAGGICQVSSTLYNTGLLANLQVTQRSNHDLAISYVPLGQDATVAYPDLDLKFNNNTGGYLLIRTSTTSNSLTIDLYGKAKPGQEVIITNKTESEIPPEEQRNVDETLGHGASVVKQRGQPGYIVNSTRTIKMNGKVVSSEPLNKSVYKALPTIIAVGS